MVAIIRKGANGTSDFKLILSEEFREVLLRIMRKTLHNAPSQKANITAEIPEMKPSNAPIPKTSLASPKPIHLPPDTSQSRAKGINNKNGVDKLKISKVSTKKFLQ